MLDGSAVAPTPPGRGSANTLNYAVESPRKMVVSSRAAKDCPFTHMTCWTDRSLPPGRVGRIVTTRAPGPLGVVQPVDEEVGRVIAIE